MSGSKIILTFDYVNDQIVAKWDTKKKTNKACSFPGIILESLFTKLSYYNHGTIGKRIS